MVKQSLWFRLPLAILTLFAVGLTQSSSISPASLTTSMLGNEIVISDLTSDDLFPNIAYNSIHDEYLVVWESVWPELPRSIYAQRISANGRLLGMFLVASNTNNQIYPDVAYDPIKDRYLVVFAYDYWGDGSDWDIYGRFIPWNGPDPNLLDFAICTWPTNQMSPSVAFAYSAEEFMVTWTNFPVGEPSYIGARRVYSTGGFPPGYGFIVSIGTESRGNSDVAYNLARNEYLVIWQLDKDLTLGDIAGVRFDSSGEPLSGGNPHQVGEFSIAGWPDFEERPAIASCHNADQYMVVWQSNGGIGGSSIYARYLSGGADLGSVQLVRSTTTPNFDADIACDALGKKYLIVWTESYVSGGKGIWARFVHPNGNLDPAFEVVAGSLLEHRSQPAVMGGKTNFMTAWQHLGTNPTDIHGILVGYFLYLPFVIK